MPATQHCARLVRVSQPQILHRQLNSESSRPCSLWPCHQNLHLNQYKQVSLQTGWCSSSYAQRAWARTPGRKRWNKPTGISCPHTNAAMLLKSRVPFGLQGLFAWTQGWTRSVANCSYSHAPLLLPPSHRSTAQYPWLTCGTCPSPQHLPAYSKSRKGESTGNSPQLGLQQIQIHIHTASPSIMEAALLSHWRAAAGRAPTLSD